MARAHLVIFVTSSHVLLFHVVRITPRAVAMPLVRTFATPAAPSGDVVVPELVDTLEWVIESPPNIHQFDEPPVSMEFSFS